MGPRTTGAIPLWPTGKSQGGHYFYSLTSGRRLNRNKWMLLPMPMEVIERVHQLAGKGLTWAEEVDFYHRNSDDTEDSSVDSCEVVQQAINIDANDSRSYIDVYVHLKITLLGLMKCQEKKKLSLYQKMKLFQKCTNRHKDSHHSHPLKNMKNKTHLKWEPHYLQQIIFSLLTQKTQYPWMSPKHNFSTT